MFQHGEGIFNGIGRMLHFMKSTTEYGTVVDFHFFLIPAYLNDITISGAVLWN